MKQNYHASTLSGNIRSQLGLNMKKIIARSPPIQSPNLQNYSKNNLKSNNNSYNQTRINSNYNPQTPLESPIYNNSNYNSLNSTKEIEGPISLRKYSSIQNKSSNNKSRPNALATNENKTNNTPLRKDTCINQLPQSPIAFKKSNEQNVLEEKKKSKSVQRTVDPKCIPPAELTKRIPHLTIINKPPQKSIFSPKSFRKDFCNTQITNDETPIIRYEIPNQITQENDIHLNRLNNEKILMTNHIKLGKFESMNIGGEPLKVHSMNQRQAKELANMIEYPLSRLIPSKNENEIKSMSSMPNPKKHTFSEPLNCQKYDPRVKTDYKNNSFLEKSFQNLTCNTFDSSLKDFGASLTKSTLSNTSRVGGPNIDLKLALNTLPKQSTSTATNDQENNYYQNMNSDREKKLPNSLAKTTEQAISYSKHIFDNIFHRGAQKRTKCSCEYGLKETDTCRRAMNWLSLRYAKSELEYLDDTYKKLLESDMKNNDYVIQIEKDITRTFPSNKFFSNKDEGLKSLERVLNAFAKYEPQIGYVQGMNFISGSLLYHAEEYIAFWLLAMIFEKFELRDIYLPKLPGLSKHCQIIDILVGNYVPDLYAHLCLYEIKVEMFCAEWIFTLFSCMIPVELIGVFYDNMLIQGWPYFYKVILAFLMEFKKQILNENDFISILTILKSQNQAYQLTSKDKNAQMDWNMLFDKALKLEIDNNFIYNMHSNYDQDTQQFKVKL